MSLNAHLDYFDGKRLRGWVRFPKGSMVAVVVRMLSQSLDFVGPDYHPRSDVRAIDGFEARGFTIDLANPCQIGEFSEVGQLIFVIDGVEISAVLSSGIRAAAEFESVDFSRLKSAWPMLNRSSRAVIADVSREFFSPWRPLVDKRHACVVTYANSSGAWFDYFYSYYTRHLGERAIYVVTTDPEAFSSYALAGLVSLPDARYADSPRAQLVSGIVSGLVAYYEHVLLCDVDEFLIPNPRLYGSLSEALSQGSAGGYSFALGLDVLEMPGDRAFSFDCDIISQRAYGILNSAMCKPMVNSVGVRFCMGHHFCDKPVNIDPRKPKFFNLHLKYASSHVRVDLARMVERVGYEDDVTHKYSAESVALKAHPAYRAAASRGVLGINSKEVIEFIDVFKSSAVLNEYTGHVAAEHRVLPRLIDLRSILA